jgi:hypothetical protein
MFNPETVTGSHHTWQSKVGLTCHAVRETPLAHWRGYVTIPQGHIFYGKDYNDCIKPNRCHEPSAYHYCEHTAEYMLSVHGGITFAGNPGPNWIPAPTIPTNEDPVDPNEWWLGFDCAHAGDDYPSSAFHEGVYRDLNYVIEQCEHLAEQLV